MQTTYSSLFDISLAVCVVLPLLSFLLSLSFSERYSWIMGILAPFLLLLSSIGSVIVFSQAWPGPDYDVHATWFRINQLEFNVGINIDNNAAVMLFVVTLISFLVHLFSTGYMAGDSGEKRYFGMLGLFTFAMQGVVLADNLLLIFVFWELVGFSSYMLIGHWRHKPSAAAAATKAFLLNRIGDVGFIIAILFVWRTADTLSVSALAASDISWSTFAGLCILCGVIGKSAQFPLFTWLPDAMEGPTPVSALIHAATMVAAGVYLLARVFFLFSPEALAVVAVIGIITALLGAGAALVQNDIKKVLAYSTISQLGLMVTAVGAGAPGAAMLHLFAHAFFKAGLFLCAGSIIHVLHQAQRQSNVHFDVQDIRNLGGLRKKLPFTFFATVISGASLAGLPLFSGFLSKEAILSSLNLWKGDTLNGRWIVLALAFVVSFLTVAYIFRLIYRVFFGQESATHSLSVVEPPPVMRAPVALLAIASLWPVIAMNPFNPEGWFYVSSHGSSIAFILISTLWVLAALVVAVLFFWSGRNIYSPSLYEMFYIDRFYQWAFVNPVLALSRVAQSADRKVIDGFLHGVAYTQVITAHLIGWFDSFIIDGIVNGVASLTRFTGAIARSFIDGKIQLYIFWALFTVIIFLIWSLI